MECLSTDTNDKINEYILFEIIAEANNIYKDIITDYAFSFIMSSKTIQVEIALEPCNHRWLDNVTRDIKILFETKFINSLGVDICVLNKEKDYFSNRRKKHIIVLR